ncbi:MAG: glycerol-3-phosphate acyltransferase [Firmicutes bacterium]|nr:glycerol-3-phosphate acyltransferase [Bacillota bacterium]
MKWGYLFFIAAGFFCGGILFSWLIPKLLKGIDIIRLSDDHNPGTANAMKYGGVAVGLLCLAFDLAKAYLPVHFALQRLDQGDALFALVIAAPVLGHAFSPMTKFRGGKAIAALFGVCIALLPLVPSGWILAVLYIFFSTVCVIKTNAYCSAVTMALFILDMAIFHPLTPVSVGIMMSAAVVLLKHVPSLRRESCSVHPPLLLERGKELLEMKKQAK